MIDGCSIFKKSVAGSWGETSRQRVQLFATAKIFVLFSSGFFGFLRPLPPWAVHWSDNVKAVPVFCFLLFFSPFYCLFSRKPSRPEKMSSHWNATLSKWSYSSLIRFLIDCSIKSRSLSITLSHVCPFYLTKKKDFHWIHLVLWICYQLFFFICFTRLTGASLSRSFTVKANGSAESAFAYNERIFSRAHDPLDFPAKNLNRPRLQEL